ncbi:MAG: DUF2752 domain-containing protein [Bryobacteraceae bacterium]
MARLALPIGALCVCALTDPLEPVPWIVCPFRLLTGLPCPLCGMTRGLAALLRGRWLDAISFHVLSPLVLAALLSWIVIDAGHAIRLWNIRRVERWALNPAPWLAFLGVCTIYGALRWCGIIGSPPA